MEAPIRILLHSFGLAPIYRRSALATAGKGDDKRRGYEKRNGFV